MAIEFTKKYTDGKSYLELFEFGGKIVFIITQINNEKKSILIELNNEDLEELICDLNNLKKIKTI